MPDRSFSYLVVAALLALVGGRFGRRAALRGVLSIGLTAAAAHPARLAARRRSGVQPMGAAERWRRRHLPPAPSLPSSRAASAFAFAVGAGQELPVAAVPLVALAGLASWYPARQGSRHPADIAVGAALGTAVAVATRRLWPVAPHDPAEGRWATVPSYSEPSPEGAGLVVVVNLAAGTSKAVADKLRTDLPSADVVELDEGEDVARALERAAARCKALGVAGGDGTVNAAAEAAARYSRPLVVFPAGTLNHFAHAVGVDTLDDAVAAVREGSVVQVDRSEIAGRTFVNTASLGSYVELVDARERLEDRIGKWPAMVLALFGVLRHSEPVEVEIDGEPGSVWMVFVGNCRYHPDGFAPSWRERLDDGMLDVRIVHGHPWSRTRLLASVLTGRLARCRTYEQRYVRRMKLRSSQGPLRLARDGETFDGPEEFEICKAPDPLLVLVPQR